MAILNTLDPRKFMTLVPSREAEIAKAEAKPLPKVYPINALAAALHPVCQHLVVSKVTELAPDCKCYELTPDASKGTETLAYFNAGKYLSFTLPVAGDTLTRPYSIASSPKEALGGIY